MDRIDVLGNLNSRVNLFTKELLAETDDAELQEIVKNAAKELNTPIALVSLVLDQVQFFKAHVGLPPVLADARGTHRDVSFCQFVVRDAEIFEVTDASNDPRIPKHVVKEYNIQAYLGVPIKVEEEVMGSLCVLDTKPRKFSKKEHVSLQKLAALVNIRLNHITKNRRQTRLNLTETTLVPAISEVFSSLKSIEKLIQLGYSSGKSMQTYLNHSKHIFSDKSAFSDAIRLSFEGAAQSHKQHEHSLLEMELALQDSIDCIKALEQLVINIGATPISEIVTSAQDLARNSTKLIGGFPLPDFKSDPTIHTKGNLALAIITNCLLLMSSELEKLRATTGISLDIKENKEWIELIFSASDLNEDILMSIHEKLENIITGEVPSFKLTSKDATLTLNFKTISKTHSDLD